MICKFTNNSAFGKEWSMPNNQMCFKNNNDSNKTISFVV